MFNNKTWTVADKVNVQNDLDKAIAKVTPAEAKLGVEDLKLISYALKNAHDLIEKLVT